MGKMNRALAPQPYPIFTATGHDEANSTQIVRVWQPGDAEICRLCKSCTSFTLANGVSVCYVQASVTVPEGDSSSLYSESSPPRPAIHLFAPPAEIQP